MLLDGLFVGLWIQAAGVAELVGRLASSLLIEDTLCGVDYVGAILGCALVGLPLTVGDHADNFAEFGRCGLFRLLDVVDLLIALPRQFT
ncbi:MAG: hypothetical protein QJR12_03720 [Mycobacterium sp.]|uniref:hypothetical protein n=1 Tax=Mycobacterium sp. TaxID=1785 RepID=UPI002639F8B1|nr:hypothetical protein [Mycobacterium sp.]MDI3313414.1 hypothetical protein [Mycobacterium sp.]